ncbi:MAG: reverse transcriptase family protein [Bacteroidota bacterium]
MNKKTRERHAYYKSVFCSINSVHTLARLLNIDIRRLRLLVDKPSYKTFRVPKKGGGERIIEAPGHELKQVLGRLNRYLQSVYYFEKSAAAYGFILGVRNDDDRRNVLTNARKHLNKSYLLNVDLKDFFHAVTREQVLEIFLGKPFSFKREIPDLLADLCTYDGRLPMGTPTSPVLSNFACQKLDEELVGYSKDLLWVYTRYADDMSFSSNRYINEEQQVTLINLIKGFGFKVNQRKLKLYGPDEPKVVTGLLVTDKVSLAEDYIPTLKQDIEQLNQTMRIQNEHGQLSTKWVEQHKKQILGRLNFAGFVLKRNHPDYLDLKQAFYSAIHPPEEEFSAMSWRGFPYNF